MMLEEMNLLGAEELLYEKGNILTDLVPNRAMFHISEVSMWFHLCGKLAALKGDFATAKTNRDLLNDLEPNCPAAADLDRLMEMDEGNRQMLEMAWRMAKLVKDRKGV